MDLFDFSVRSVEFEVEELDEEAREIHERARARAKRYLAAEGELLESIAEVDAHRLYESFAYTHLTPYCVKELGLSEEVAACFVRVARKSRAVPELKRAVAEGRVNLTKAKTIASVITPKNQEEWIERAASLTKDKLEKAVAAENPLEKKPEKAKPVGENRTRVEFEFTEEEMELFRRAQEVMSSGKLATLAETARAALLCLLEKRDPLRKAARRERAKAQAERRARANANVEQTKAEATPPNPAAPKTTPANPRSSQKHSQERSQEQSRGKIPAKVAHAVNLRDQGRCQAKLPSGEICGEKKWTELHHIRPRREGGAHSPENLLTLCGSHHRQWHRRAKDKFSARSASAAGRNTTVPDLSGHSDPI